MEDQQREKRESTGAHANFIATQLPTIPAHRLRLRRYTPSPSDYTSAV